MTSLNKDIRSFGLTGEAMTDSGTTSEEAKTNNKDVVGDAASIFAQAAEGAVTQNKIENSRKRYLQDRKAAKQAFVTNVQGVIKALQSLRGVNGERFHVIMDAKNFKARQAKNEDGSYSTPEILIAMAYEKDIPYRFKHDRWLRDARQALCKHASYYDDGREAKYDVDTDLNGFFLTKANSTVYERGESSTTYFEKPAMGIFITPETVQIVRCDQKPRTISELFEDFGWGYNLRNWHRVKTPVGGSISPIYNEISGFITDNCTIARKDLLAVAKQMEAPYKPSIMQRISNKLKFG